MRVIGGSTVAFTFTWLGLSYLRATVTAVVLCIASYTDAGCGDWCTYITQRIIIVAAVLSYDCYIVLPPASVYSMLPAIAYITVC